MCPRCAGARQVCLVRAAVKRGEGHGKQRMRQMAGRSIGGAPERGDYKQVQADGGAGLTQSRAAWTGGVTHIHTKKAETKA